jgi:hypothetical protein
MQEKHDKPRGNQAVATLLVAHVLRKVTVRAPYFLLHSRWVSLSVLPKIF